MAAIEQGGDGGRLSEAAPAPASEARAAAARRGPSGQALKGPVQRTTVLETPVVESENTLHTPSIELKNVRKVYNEIAEHWNHTRYKAWPRVDEFVQRLPPGSLVADLGCGNGKMIPAVTAARGFAVASDASEPLARIAAETFGASTFVADCLHTPLRSGIFDAALSIAVLHHLSTEPRRVRALSEAARLLRPGGELLVYCWSYEQDEEKSRSRHRFEGQDVLVPWKHRTPGVRKPKGTAAAAPEAPAAGAGEAAAAAGGDADWEAEPEVRQRYCHVYREGELVELLAQVPELEVVESWFDTGNWCAIARRRAD